MRWTETGLSSSTIGRRPPGLGVRMTWRSWEPVAAIASTVAIWGQERDSMPSSETLGGGDHAVVDGLDVVGAVLAQAGAALVVDGVLDAGAPGRHLALGDLVARGRFDGAVPAGLLRGEAGQPLQLLGDDGALEAALGAGRRVLPVAAAALAGAGERAGRLDAVLGGGVDLHGVGAQEAGALLAVGDAGGDALAGEGVPDEKDLALVGAGDAVAAVGDRSDLDLVLLADQRLLRFCLHGGGAPEVGWCGGAATGVRRDNSLQVYVPLSGARAVRREPGRGRPATGRERLSGGRRKGARR